MSAGPFIVSALFFAASVAWSVRLALTDSELAGSSSALIAGGVIVLATIGVAGMLLARSRWARPLAAGLTVLTLVLVPALPGGELTIALAALSAIALAAVTGPWLRGWLRRRPAALGPPPRIAAMLLGFAAIPVAAGLAAPDGVNASHWALAVISLGLGWSYARGYVAALWGLRLVLPAAGVAAAVWSPPVGAIALLAILSVLVGVAWTREASVLAAPLVAPRVPAFRIPPELAPPEVLDAAGLDEHGRPRPSP